MTKEEFRSAFGAIALALGHRRAWKPKSLLHATREYARGTLAKPRHIEELREKTLDELFEMLYAFEGPTNPTEEAK